MNNYHDTMPYFGVNLRGNTELSQKIFNDNDNDGNR
jgi:hypothetical protein